MFAAGSFRYSEVDPIDPIIAVECNSGFDVGANVMATAPSVITVAGSQVVRIYTYRVFEPLTTGDSHSNNDISGSFSSIAARSSINVSMQGTTELSLAGGPTGEASIELGQTQNTVAGWRACTIALRMAPVVRNVPTMSEWGILAFAGFLGIAGMWALRRRAVRA